MGKSDSRDRRILLFCPGLSDKGNLGHFLVVELIMHHVDEETPALQIIRRDDKFTIGQAQFPDLSNVFEHKSRFIRDVCVSLD